MICFVGQAFLNHVACFFPLSLISLWTGLKKKPLFTVHEAHGKDPVNQEPRWISALAALPSTDLIATGERFVSFLCQYST